MIRLIIKIKDYSYSFISIDQHILYVNDISDRKNFIQIYWNSQPYLVIGNMSRDLLKQYALEKLKVKYNITKKKGNLNVLKKGFLVCGHGTADSDLHFKIIDIDDDGENYDKQHLRKLLKKYDDLSDKFILQFDTTYYPGEIR